MTSPVILYARLGDRLNALVSRNLLLLVARLGAAPRPRTSSSGVTTANNNAGN
jgi:hypothetical protein